MLYSVLVTAVAMAIYMDRHASAGDVDINDAWVRQPKEVVPLNHSVPTEAASLAAPGKSPERAPAETAAGDPFATKTWAVATPVFRTTTPARETPTTPPLPYAYAGKLEESDGRWVVYLVKGDTPFNLHQGETFDTNYRLNTIQADQLEIEYLPLATKQTLSTVIESQ